MAKKAKKRVHPMPKLGWKDLLLYWSAMIITGGGALGSLLLPVSLRQKNAFSDPWVAAFTEGSGSLHNFWLFFWLLIVFMVIAAGPYQHRFPVFGRKDIKYGPPAYPRTYPLLMKNKPKYWVSPKKVAFQKKACKISAAVLLVTLLFSLAMYPRSLYGRKVLHHNGTITVYDSANNEAAYYSRSDITAVVLDTYTTGGGKYSRRKWTAGMTFHTSDGETFGFSAGSFQGDWAEGLQTMLALKEGYGGLVTIEGAEDLWKVVFDRNLDAAEEELLYALFSADP